MKMSVKNLKIIAIVAMFFWGFNIDLIGAGQRQRGKSSTTATRKGQPARAQARSRSPQRPATTQQKKIGATQASQRAPQKAPQQVDPVVWDQLVEAGQQAKFKDLSNKFEKEVSIISTKTEIWKRNLIDRAKPLIALNPELLDYCIETIENDLKAGSNKKDIETRADERGITDTKDFIETIKNTLRAYLPESILITGTLQEQLKNLMDYIPRSEDGRPTMEWVAALYERAKDLVVVNKTLTLGELKRLLTAELAKNMPNAAQFITAIINQIEAFAINEQLQNTPESINNRFQRLLFDVATNTQYWDRAKNQPTLDWINDIVEAGKKMVQKFNMPLKEIEDQIGAQVYFVAVIKVGRALSDSEDQAITSLVNIIMDRIKA